MKYLILIILISFGLFSHAQIPEIKSNVGDKTGKNTIVYNKLHGKYNFWIACRIYSGWRINKITYITVLAHKNKSWKRIILSYPDDKPNEIKLKKKTVDKKKAEDLMAYLNDQNFWNLDKDSLIMYQKQTIPKGSIQSHVKNDTIVVMGKVPARIIRVMDGYSVHFEIFQSESQRFYGTEDPEAYFKHLPEIKCRANFIRSKNAFLKAMDY